MLSWALIFLVFALIAGVLGFGVVAGTAAWIAKVLFVLFLVLFLIGLLERLDARTNTVELPADYSAPTAMKRDGPDARNLLPRREVAA